jgi:hypothetical protein
MVRSGIMARHRKLADEYDALAVGKYRDPSPRTRRKMKRMVNRLLRRQGRQETAGFRR